MDPTDQMDQVYEAFVHWADVLVIALPIRWGAPARSTSRWSSA
jgi:multimeric flavodoxin WrbA